MTFSLQWNCNRALIFDVRFVFSILFLSGCCRNDFALLDLTLSSWSVPLVSHGPPRCVHGRAGHGAVFVPHRVRHDTTESSAVPTNSSSDLPAHGHATGSGAAWPDRGGGVVCGRLFLIAGASRYTLFSTLGRQSRGVMDTRAVMLVPHIHLHSCPHLPGACARERLQVIQRRCTSDERGCNSRHELCKVSSIVDFCIKYPRSLTF